ncbi:MAG TPA: PHB depolymerase family esterase [Phycisphaerae bacterium]|nr:PHB depolymerase family esterase [Phycisphaerae bacterium]
MSCSTVFRAAVLAVSLLTAGCAVPQSPGKGTLTNLVEANSGRHYWLYLPGQYPAQTSPHKTAERWPLVVTLHGMKPFDSYSAQIREWQQQADAYGLIVCAPDLHTSDIFMELPLQHVHSYVERDERMILDMMDQVLRRTDADPNRVLITSWSSGGYLAHYVLNRHPERFACLAVRQSNFSASILDPRQIREYPRYPDTPIAIFFGQNDLLICRKESREAVVWYREHGFRRVEAYSVEGLGHERTPETAANFFARVCRFQPLDKALAQRSLARVRAQPVALASAQPTAGETPAGTGANPHRERPARPENTYLGTDALGRLSALNAEKQPGD